MIAKKIEERAETGSILGAAARLMGASIESQDANDGADVQSAIQAYQADMAEKVGRIYSALNDAEATLRMSIGGIEKVMAECADTPMIHDVSSLDRVIRMVTATLSSSLDELSEIESDLCTGELSDRFGILGREKQNTATVAPERGATDLPSRISPDIQYAVQVLTLFEARGKALSEARAEFEVHNNPKLEFSDSGPEWKKWVKNTPYSRLCEQEDSVQEIISALEGYIRSADCASVDDIAAKVQVNRFWIDDLDESAGDMAEYSAALVRSIAAMFPKSAT